MKKLLITTAVFSAFSLGANAQNISLAPEVGLNMSGFYGEDVPDGGKMNFGLKAGTNVNIGITENLYFQPGVFYSMKGANRSTELPIVGTIKSKITMNYLEIPMNGMYKMNTGNGDFFVTAGPYVALGLNGKATTKNKDGVTETEDKVKFSNKDAEYKQIDFGANFGLGYELRSGVYVRAQYGLGFLRRNNDVGSIKSADVKHSVIQLSIGYSL